MNGVIEDLTVDRYNLARKAPVMKMALTELNEMENVDLQYTKDLVEGVVPILDEVDDATRLYIEEIRELAARNMRSHGDKFVMTGRQFSEFWRKVKENTQSSV